MSLDGDYYHNELAFHCLSSLGLFPLYHHYVEVSINGMSEGLYLLVQRPADYALEQIGSPGILRRGSTEFITKEKFGKSTSKETQQECKNTFKEIKSPGHRSGEELYQYLNERIDLNAYFSWLAFNYLVRNGDYTDEVFYYILPNQTSTRFGIIPWDFDDILVKDPHEGRELRDRQLDDQLIFSSEDKLDRLIARDPYLYEQYLIQFDKVMQVLDPQTLTEIFDQIEQDLAPYFETNSVVEASKHDFRPVESWQGLKDHLGLNLGYLKNRVAISRSKINQ
jgi:spore coat protein H